MAVFVADEQAGDQPAGPAPLDAARLRRLAAFVLADRAVPESMELSVLAVDVEAMAELNARHMGASGPTDVLAFPLDMPGDPTGDVGAEVPTILGDVVLCPAVAARQAVEHGTDPQAEQDLLLVHGILHLLGHDHAEEAERREMFALTDRLLADFAADAPDPPDVPDGAAP